MGATIIAFVRLSAAGAWCHALLLPIGKHRPSSAETAGCFVLLWPKSLSDLRVGVMLRIPWST